MKLHNRVNGAELKKRMLESQEQRITVSFYQYHHILNPSLFRDHLYRLFDDIGVYGRVYVAKEGINAQVSVPDSRWNDYVAAMASIDFLKDIRLNSAIEDNGKSFFKLKILVKDKILADGLSDDTFDVTDRGEHLSAVEFNKLLAQDDTVIIDMRNHYESEIGYFAGAIRPDVETFRESLPIIEEILEPHRDKNILMYCTGGIRCEKASAWFKHRGFPHVHQLEGGIIEYARQVDNLGLENKFRGKNFVFDERLGERISEEIVAHCHQCGKLCDTHINCANDACHILFIQCEECAEKYNKCCSDKCADFIELPEEERKELRKTEVFNGTRFGKGRSGTLMQASETKVGE